MPIATKKPGGIAFAFPNVCKTPPPAPGVPIPYPNIGQLSQADNASDSSTGTGEVKAGGYLVILAKTSVIQSTLGDQAGSGGGVQSGPPPGGKVEFTSGSGTVKIHGKSVVRMTDPTTQNAGNANGIVLGGVPNILVGG
jgi:hypothetical protein